MLPYPVSSVSPKSRLFNWLHYVLTVMHHTHGLDRVLPGGASGSQLGLYPIHTAFLRMCQHFKPLSVSTIEQYDAVSD